MKPVFLHGAAVAALLVGAQAAAPEAATDGGGCPWIANHVPAFGLRPAQPAAGDPETEDVEDASPGAPHPLRTKDCAAGKWRQFSTPAFETQEECAGWVLENLRPRMLRILPPGESIEFDFPQRENGSAVPLRSGAPLLI